MCTDEAKRQMQLPTCCGGVPDTVCGRGQVTLSGMQLFAQNVRVSPVVDLSEVLMLPRSFLWSTTQGVHQ